MNRSRAVRLALYANAAFSTLTGLAMLIAPGPLAELAGVQAPWVLRLVGAGLLPFAGTVIWEARRPTVAPGQVVTISLLDFAWVIGTGGLAWWWPEAMGPRGWELAWGVAGFVALFGALQIRGLVRLFRNPAPSEAHPGRSLLCAERIVPVEPDRAWAIVSDVGGYAGYAPSLDFSRIVSGEGVGAIRECGDAQGSWKETACRWDEGRAYAFRVHTDAPDYPYPFEVLGGHWEVEPAAGGTRIVMRFDFTVKGGWLGEVLAAVAMAPKFAPALETLLDNWEHAMGTPDPIAEVAAGKTVRT